MNIEQKQNKVIKPTSVYSAAAGTYRTVKSASAIRAGAARRERRPLIAAPS